MLAAARKSKRQLSAESVECCWTQDGSQVERRLPGQRLANQACHVEVDCVCGKQVLVSHVVDTDAGVLVHLQQSDQLVQLEQMLDRLDDVYSASEAFADTTATYRRGDAVAACIATIWQRATVLRDIVAAADTCTVAVQCVDFGSVHDVDVDKVRPLVAELMTEPAFAFECQLFGVDADTGVCSLLSLIGLLT